MDRVEKSSLLKNIEKEHQTTFEVRLHHITSLYYTMCLTPEEQARTPMFNDANTYGEDFARKMEEFYRNVLQQPDLTKIEIVGSLDEVCAGCPIVNDSCRLEDRQDDYQVPKLLGLNVGDSITIGELKEKLIELYPRHKAPWKDEEWSARLTTHPHLAKYTKDNFWLYKKS